MGDQQGKIRNTNFNHTTNGSSALVSMLHLYLPKSGLLFRRGFSRIPLIKNRNTIFHYSKERYAAQNAAA